MTQTTQMQSLMNAIAYIERTLTSPPDYSEIARRAHMSGYHFQRLFSIMCGCTVGEYIRSRRLSLAMTKLVSTKESVTDIAFEYGYDTLEGFSRAFARHYGITPSAARAQGRALPAFERFSAPQMNTGGRQTMDDMTKYSTRGYYVKENAPVYFTPDIEATCRWFRDTLGWYGDVSGRTEDGTASYGCVFDYPGELIVAGLTPFRGIHLFVGKPAPGVVAFINVQGLEALRQLVLSSGWTRITEITEQPWDARECDVTTPEGTIIRFFETR